MERCLVLEEMLEENEGANDVQFMDLRPPSWLQDSIFVQQLQHLKVLKQEVEDLRNESAHWKALLNERTELCQELEQEKRHRWPRQGRSR